MQKQKSVRARKKRRMSYNAKTRLWLVLCYPVGLTRMWRARCSWSLGKKYAVSSIALVVLLAVMLSFVLFNADTLTQAGNDFAAMFGFGGLPMLSKETGYYLRSYAPLLIAACIGATPLIKKAAGRLGENHLVQTLEPLVWLGLLLLCTAYLVDGSFSPFLYFRF